MAKEKVKPLLTSFTPDGEYLAVLSPNGTVKVWSTKDGSLVSEWQWSDSESTIDSSCSMSLSLIGKKHKKASHKCLLALAAKNGNISTFDAFKGEMKWEFSECNPGGVAGISFLKKGRGLCVIGNNGTVYEMNSETGEALKDLKVSKRPISFVAFSCDEKRVAIVSKKVRILELENGKELVKFPDDVGPLKRISMSDNGKTVITAGIEQTRLQVWNCDDDSRTAVKGPVLTLSNVPIGIECRSSSNEQDTPVVLTIPQSGPTYLWNLKNVSENANTSKISVKTKKSIFAAKLHSVEADKPIKAVAAYGSMDAPKFSHVEISREDENFLTPEDDVSADYQANGGEVSDTRSRDKKMNRKRSDPDPDIPAAKGMQGSDLDEDTEGGLFNGDPNEPTMGEKLADLSSVDDDSKEPPLEPSLPNTTPPTAASVNVLLKQALNADDRSLLLDCLYNRDEKVIVNSVAKLNPSDVLKLLSSLVQIIQSRGAVLACAIPWIKCLLRKHTGGILSQESSLLALNTMYQLIESRISNLQTAVEVSSGLDFLYTGIVGDMDEEDDEGPVVYEVNNTDDEEDQSMEAMETDNDEDEDADSDDGVSDFQVLDDMSE